MLITFLLTLAFIALLSSFISWHSQKILQQTSFSAHASHSKEVAGEKALVEFSGPGQLGNSLLDCRRFEAQNGRASATRELCSRRDLSGALLSSNALIEGNKLNPRRRFPQFNYNRIFRLFSDCPTELSTSLSLAPSGFELSKASAFSDQTCEDPTIDTSNFIAPGNLVFKSEFAVAAPTLLIAASGYLDAGAGLTVESDVVLLAAGDLHLKALTSATAGAKITLISASGMVVIDEIVGEPTLRIIAWQGALYPASAKFLAHDVFPPTLPESPISLTAAKLP